MCKAGIWGEKLGLGRESGPGAESNCRHADFQSRQPSGWKGNGKGKGDSSALGKVVSALSVDIANLHLKNWKTATLP